MKKTISLLLSVILIIVLFCSCKKNNDQKLNNDWEKIVESGKVKIGAIYDPYLTADSNGNATGFTVDLIDAIMDSIGIEYEITPVSDIESGISMLEKNLISCLWGVDATPAVLEENNCSSPYIYTDYVAVFANESIASQYPTAPSLRNLGSLAVVADSAAATAATTANLKWAAVSSITEAFDLTLSGSVPACIVEYAQALPIISLEQYSSLKFGTVIGSTGKCIMYRENSSLNPKIRSAMKKLTENGTLDSLAEPYLYSAQLASNHTENN